MSRNTSNPYVAANQAVIQAQAMFQQALILHQRGQLTQAKTLYEDILKILPKHFDALHLLGVIASQTRNPQLAVELMDKAIKINPNVAEIYSNRGVALKDLKHFDAALASYDRAITLRPDYAEVYNNRGNVFKILKQLDAALANYDKAITLRPDYAEAYNNRGNALKDLKQFDSALASFDKAIALKPDYAGAYNNRGITLTVLNQLNSAIACFDKAIALKPRYAEAYNNRGNVLKDHKQLDAALASYDEAIILEPNYAEAHWNKSLLLLLLGEFDKGWKEYAWRWKWDDFPSQKRKYNQPLWNGKESLVGKTILLHSEQGLGDAIQFSRYAKMVSDLGARVILEAGKPLLNLFSTLSGVSQLVGKGSAVPSFDFHCPLLSLPLAFKTQIDSIPSSIPYLFSDPEKASRWRIKLGERYKPRIGLVWSGSTTHKNDQNRSILLAELIKHLPDQYLYVSLQKEVRYEDEEILISRPDILHFENELTDFSDTAALCDLMDVIISVDTSVAHLAGALGKEVWILLPYVPDWRWLLDRNDSPWYPTAKLYRQEVIGDWDGVLEKVKSDLMQL